MPPSELLLIPTPRALRFTGGALDISAGVKYTGPHPELAARLLAPHLNANDRAARITVEPDASLPDGAHSLAITPDGVRIRCGAGETLRHALVTLARIITQCARTLPTLELDDAPAFAHRGVMLDISRDKVPTLDSLFRLVVALERLKFNHLQLYTEHTFAYAGHEEVWQGASPLTPQELRDLSGFCEARGIELVANQNCLGHLHRWFALPRYAPLAEIQGADTPWTFETDDGRRIEKRGPFSLCPTDPRSLELVRDLLDQLLPCCASPFANIGFDEAYDLGQGRSRAAALNRSCTDIYCDFLRDVCTIVRAHKKRPMFWADILLKDPSALRRQSDALPPGRDGPLPLIWGYEADTPFNAHCDTLRSAGHECWVCPGTSSWLSIVGRSRVRAANLAAASACASKATGFLITDWGDQGHRQHWPISLHAIAHAAQAAWNPYARFDPRAAGLHCFGDSTGALGPFIEDLGAVDADLSERLALRNRSALYAELQRPIADPNDDARHGSAAEWQTIRNDLAALRSRFDALAPEACDEKVRAELDHTLQVAEHAADKAIVRRATAGAPSQRPGGAGGAALIRLAADMGSISETHRELWLKRNRPGGLDDSAAWYERIVDDYEHPKQA
jgi:hypothetical protein